jgi:ABC-2 type transport system permease protein
MLHALVKKELREIAREGRLRAALLVALGLLAVALAFGVGQARALNAEHEAAQHGAEEHWRSQEEKNPHVAAHYGMHVFKPRGPLRFVDPGVEPFVGSSLKLEAHRRNDVTGAQALDATALSRFGGLSVAAVLQLLVPVLIVALGFAAWTAERERGTLRQLLSLGVLPRSLLAGKALALLAAMATVLLPGALAIVVAAGSTSGDVQAGDPARLLGLLVSYGAYALTFVFLTLAVSARAQTSRGALVALLGVWVLTTQVLPRVAADAAVLIAPAPTHAATRGAVEESLANGLPGGAPREDRVAEIADKMLEEQGFAGAETLMDASLLAGIELAAEAQFENEVIDHHFAVHARAVAHQERVAETFGALSPLIATRSLSRGFAGTDLAHHQHFTDRAEAHRRALVDSLNLAFASRGGAQGWSYRAGREVWESSPPFEYEVPSAAWVARHHRLSIAALGAWLLVAAALAYRGAARLRVV